VLTKYGIRKPMRWAHIYPNTIPKALLPFFFGSAKKPIYSLKIHKPKKRKKEKKRKEKKRKRKRQGNKQKRKRKELETYRKRVKGRPITLWNRA
jgi:hypothetical protein